MRNRINVEKKSFFIDEEAGVTVCELTINMQLYKHPAFYVLKREMWKNRFPKIRKSGVFKVRAKARLNKIDGDTYNKTIGMRVAESRAKAKAYNIARRIYTLCYNYFNNMADSCYITGRACEEEYKHEIEHINHIITNA